MEAGKATVFGIGQDGANQSFELAHGGTLLLFPALVAELGGDASELMRQVGIDPAALDGYAPRLNYRSMIELLERAAASLQRPDFGMRLAMVQGGGKVFGPIGVVMRNSTTFGEALRYVADHIQAYSLAASMRIELDSANAGRTNRKVLVHFDILLEGVSNKSQTLEQLMLLAHRNALEITSGRARVREVRFRHQPVASLKAYRDYFGCEVRFDQATDSIVFSQDDLLAPIAAAEAQHFEMARFFIDSQFPASAAPMHARVRGVILRHVGNSDCSVERIAGELCVHPRTLRRQLQREARSFEGIKDDVRRDLALYYLQRTNLSFAHICEKLGYSEPAVLSRCCVRWFGRPPSEVRKHLDSSDGVA